MNQAFFTLSLGIGAMAIFGSYIGKERSLLGESINVAVLDTGIFRHRDFDNRIVAFKDFVNGKNIVYDDSASHKYRKATVRYAHCGFCLNRLNYKSYLRIMSNGISAMEAMRVAVEPITALLKRP